MTDALRVGLVGYGSAGRGIHARLLREVGADVVRVVSRN
ncbi:gfo/Idh/MocA family oxidoreductase, partial [Cellulomonas hominis]|nr:gfo/Idh/MocA family oxidoreductase [Cellulomonas hominis]